VKDLSRLLDECDSDLGRAILKAGRADSSELRKGRVLAAIGVGAAVTMTSKASLAMTAVWKKVFAGSVVAASSVIALTAYQASYPAPVERAGLSLGPAVEQAGSFRAASSHRGSGQLGSGDTGSGDTGSGDTGSGDTGSGDTGSGDTGPSLVEWRGAARGVAADTSPEGGFAEQSRARSTGRGSRGGGAAGVNAASLNEEVALLDKARSAVRTGRPNEGLARLDEHAARFPKGSLSLEAQVLRVQALAAAGRTEEASRRAKRILSRSPNSVVAQRLRQYVLE
jgi:hypothetical protein